MKNSEGDDSEDEEEHEEGDRPGYKESSVPEAAVPDEERIRIIFFYVSQNCRSIIATLRTTSAHS